MRDGVSLRDSASLEFLRSKGRSETRPRLRAALLDALVASHVQALSERDIAARAGLSPSRFGEYYRDVDECVYDAFDELADDIYGCFADAFAAPGDPHEQLVEGIEQALARLLANPGAMRLWFLEARQTADPELQARRSEARIRLVRLVTRPEADWGPDVPDLHVEFLFGVLTHAAYDELAGGGDCAKAGRRIRELLAVFEPLAA
jgi:AcrR family transcriptional regulator